jgi:inhibitor of KinA
LSPEEVIKRHARGDYWVAMVGFAPGFPYLMGLPRELATPRLAKPRTLVPAGSVGIAGAQTGIYPLATPGGWNLIGRAAVRLFDPGIDPPVKLQVGDRVKFRAVTREEFVRREVAS